MENNMEQKNTVESAGVEVKVGKKENANMMMFVYGFAGFIGIFALIFALYGVVRVYAQGATDGATKVVSTVLRLPLAKVDGHVIRYSEYLSDLKAIHTLNDYEKENGGLTVALDDTQMSDQVVWRLVNNIIVSDLGKAYGITVAKEDVETLKNQMTDQFESVQAAEEELMKRYGWTMEVYEKKVIKPFVLQNKIAEKLELDQTLREDVYKRAEKVLGEILGGANFEEMAQKYGEDGTAESGGDLGWFGKGDMVPQFETAVFALEKGEVSKELVETPFGYHVIRLDDMTTEKEKDAETGKTVSVEKVSARHIVFLFPSLESALDKAIKNVQIGWYVKKIHNPLNEIE